MVAPRTGKQKDSQDAYMEKLQDIKVRVPKASLIPLQSSSVWTDQPLARIHRSWNIPDFLEY